jgi:hypothetical protein
MNLEAGMGRRRESATLLMALLIGAASCSSAKGSSQPTSSLSHVVKVGPAPPADTVKDTPSSGVKACDLIRASDLTAAGVPGSISAGFDSSSNLSLGGDDPSSCEFTITGTPTTWQLIIMIDDGGTAQYQTLDNGNAFIAPIGDKVTSLELTGLGDRASLETLTDPKQDDPTTAVVAVRRRHVVQIQSNTRLAGPKTLETLAAWTLSRFGPPGS